jgi:hypothetical protein
VDSAPGLADDTLGESNIAAGSSFSALCMAWKKYKTVIILKKFNAGQKQIGELPL